MRLGGEGSGEEGEGRGGGKWGGRGREVGIGYPLSTPSSVGPNCYHQAIDMIKLHNIRNEITVLKHKTKFDT